MKRAIFAAGVTVVLLAAAAPAEADYGTGAFTYNEFLKVRVGDTKTHTSNLCDCTGTVYDQNGTDGQYNVRYDSWLSGGYVRVTYQISAPDFVVAEKSISSTGAATSNPYFTNP